MINRIICDDDDEYGKEQKNKERARAMAHITTADSFILLWTKDTKGGCVSALEQRDMMSMQFNLLKIMQELIALNEKYTEPEGEN